MTLTLKVNRSQNSHPTVQYVARTVRLISPSILHRFSTSKLHWNCIKFLYLLYYYTNPQFPLLVLWQEQYDSYPPQFLTNFERQSCIRIMLNTSTFHIITPTDIFYSLKDLTLNLDKISENTTFENEG